MKTEADSKTQKKKKFKKHYWLLVDLAIAVIIIALLLYKPAGYEPVGSGYEFGRVNQYLTYLSSEIYNGAQLQEPFDVVVIEKKLNEAIANWSEETESVRISSPVVCFEPDGIELMLTADMKGVKFVVTIGLEALIDEGGLLNMQVSKVKVGAVSITPIARIIAEKMYTQQMKNIPIDTEDWRPKIAAALLNGEPFDPVFMVEDKKVRLNGVTLAEEKLELRFIPAP